MTKKAKNPWPTDGVTKRQLDRQTDRLDRRHDHLKEKVERMILRVQELEAEVSRMKTGRIIYQGPPDPPPPPSGE